MSEDKLQDLLARVRERLAGSDAIDDAARANLSQLLHEIEARLAPMASSAGGAAQVSRLEALAVRFEAGHPGFAEALREVVDTLGKAGI